MESGNRGSFWEVDCNAFWGRSARRVCGQLVWDGAHLWGNLLLPGTWFHRGLRSMKFHRRSWAIDQAQTYWQCDFWDLFLSYILQALRPNAMPKVASVKFGWHGLTCFITWCSLPLNKPSTKKRYSSMNLAVSDLNFFFVINNYLSYNERAFWS